MTSRSWVNDSGIALSAANLNGIEADLTTALGVPDAALAGRVVAGATKTALDAVYETKAALDTDVASKVSTPATGTRVALDALYPLKSTLGANSGIATLDSSGKVTATQLPTVDYGYLITTFTANGVTDEKLSVFYSPDGKTVFGGGANLVYGDPNTGTSLRDPSTLKIGNTWFTAYTVNNGLSKNFAVIKSTDLLNWTQVALVDVSSIGSINQAWAPELILDTNGDVYVFFSSMAVTTGIGSAYRVKATASDLSTWSAPVAVSWTSAPSNIIDPTFVKSGSTWYCFYKHETTKYIERATSSSLTGTYTIDQTGNWTGWGSGVEGPELVKVNATTWRIYVDRYVAGTGYAWAESSDLTTWTALTNVTIAPGALGASQTIRHGSFYKLADQQSAAGALAAAIGRNPVHAEFDATRNTAASVGEGPGTLVTDGAASRLAGNMLSIPAPHQLMFMVSGYYSVNWVGDHSGTAAGAGAYMAIKGVGGSPIHATIDIPTASGAASIGFPAKYFAAGTIIQFFCQFGNAMSPLTSRVTVHKE